MRVTLQMNSMNSAYNVNSNSSKIYDLSNQISSGYAVTNLSDDPTAAVSAISYSAIVSQLSSYVSNIEKADSYLGLTDNSLSDVNSILTSAKSLAVEMSSGENTSEMFTGGISEMTELLSSLVSVANTDYSGQYLFAGTDYTEEAFEIVGNKYVYFKGNNEELSVKTDNSTYTAINITAEDAFGNLETTIASAELERVLNISAAYSTPLADLNSGEGVAAGSITIYYSAAEAATGGLVVDLSEAENLEDVACYIEQASIDKADTYDLTDPEYNYVLEVELNEERTALEITQIDRSTGLAVVLDPLVAPDASAIVVKDSEVARNLGLAGIGSTSGESILAGDDLEPIVTGTTLISDLKNWDSDSFTIYNGSEDNTVSVISSGDASEYFSEWQLKGLADGGNVVDDSKIYYQMTDLGSGEWSVSLYNNENMTANSLVASGTSDGGLLVFAEVNDSGVSGVVSFAPLSSSTEPIDGVLTIDFPTAYSSTINISDFVLSGSEIGSSGLFTDELISNIQLYGLEEGVTTGSTGNFAVVIDYTAAGTYLVSIENEGTVMLSGVMQSGSDGVVALEPALGFEDLGGSITLDCPDSLMTAGSYSISANATFNTIDDLTNAINSSSTYTTSQISDDGRSIEVASQLCGAYLTIAQDYSGAAVSGDTQNQLSCVELSGIVAGINSDENGRLYASVSESFDTSTSGTYVVEFYSDANRTELVAQAETSAIEGEIFVSAVDDSGISGTLYLAYAADNSGIEISNSPLVATADVYQQLAQINLTGLIEGENCGYSGELYFEIEDVSGVYEVRAYADSEHEKLVASGVAAGNGVVTMSEENYSGIAGSVYLTYQSDSSDIVVSQNSSSLSGRELEQNIFSTFTSLIESMVAEDCYAVNDQLENLDDDLNRVLSARATLGSRQNNLEVLSARHDSNIAVFEESIKSAVEVDLVQASTDYAAQKVAYEASLSVTSQLMSISLLDYI